MTRRLAKQRLSSDPALFQSMASWLRLTLVLLVAGMPLTSPAEAGDTPARVIAIGGSVTEIVYALGEGERLIARDTTSTYPEQAESLPDVGYIRALSAEGVLGLAPDLIIALEGAGPPETMAVIRASGINLVEIPDGFDAASILEKVLAVGNALGVAAKAEALAARIEATVAEAAASVAGNSHRPRALFVLSMQGGRIMAAGADTHADGIIRLAGGENAMADFSGYKPVSDEAVTVAAPEVVVMMDRGGGHAIDDAALFAHPALSGSPAATHHAIIRFDGLRLLGFGPRTAEAIVELNQLMRRAAPAAAN